MDGEKEKGDEVAEVKDLMEKAETLLDASSGEVAMPVGEERPPFYNLDFVYPERAKGVGGDLGMLFESWEVAREEGAPSRRRFGGLVALAKKMIRKLTDWYMNPLVRDIRRFNMQVTRTLAKVSADLDAIDERLDGLEEARVELQKRSTPHDDPDAT